MKYEIKLRDYNIHLLTKVSYKPNYTHTQPKLPKLHTQAQLRYILVSMILSQFGNWRLG